MCYEPDDDESVNAMLFELQIQVCVGKATGTPMLERHDVARLRCEFTADLATPRPVFKGLMRPSCLLNWSNVLPSLVVARTVAMMQRIENANFRTARSIQDLQHIRHTSICFCHPPQAIPYFASLGNEIVVRIDDEERSDLFVKLQICHVFSSYSPACGIRRHSGLFCRRGECRRIIPDELLHAQRPLPR